MPDLIRGFSARRPVKVRYSSTVRARQHVMGCLQWCLDLSNALHDG